MTANAAAAAHDVLPVYIDGKGSMLVGKDFDKIKTFSDGKAKGKRVHFVPPQNTLFFEKGKKVCDVDVAINCCHGLNGEDGTLSSLFELCNVPYVGSGVLASAIGMDKLAQKRIFVSGGLDVVPFVGIHKEEEANNFFSCIEEINQKLTFPLILKPSNLGSSIGIGRAADYSEFFVRLAEAFEWDSSVVVENALQDFVEVNCAAIKIGNNLLVSQIEQPLSEGFYSYENKYSSRSGKGETGRYLPAHIDATTAEKVRELTKTVYRLIGCSGVARVDYLIKDETVFVNEINTIPGSMASYLFAFDGIQFPQLIDKLIETALVRHKAKAKQRFSYDSNILKMQSSGAKN
jgi:D-alanine-D-alanine ligase